MTENHSFESLTVNRYSRLIGCTCSCIKRIFIENLKKKSPLFPKHTIHFLMIGTNTIVDVLAKEYPVIHVIE